MDSEKADTEKTDLEKYDEHLTYPDYVEPASLIADDSHCDLLKNMAGSIPDVILNQRQICDFELIVTRVNYPLIGFMKQVDYESVLDRMRLSTGEFLAGTYLPGCT